MSSKTMHFKKGQTILEEGELSFEAYIILDGEVDVTKMFFNRNAPTKHVHLATVNLGPLLSKLKIGYLLRCSQNRMLLI